MMITLFDQEYAAKMFEREIRKESREEGIQEGLQRGMWQGRQEGMLSTLRRLLPATGMPLDQVLTLLNVPESERPAYRELLRGQ